MIRLNEFNTRWWGDSVGILTGAAFLNSPEKFLKEREAFAWVELRLPADDEIDHRAIHRAGFFMWDTQIRYRLDLRNVPVTQSAETLERRFADEHPFGVAVEEMQPFRHDRLYLLPGVDDRKANERFALWSEQLIRDHPSLCQQIGLEGRVQGWMLGQRTEGRLNVALGMLHRQATVSGLLLYQKGMRAYAERGERVAFASFSARHPWSLNIHASLGCRFVTPEHQWVWIRE